jgi:hypothetical protein
MFVIRAASTIASESRLGCERMPRDVRDEKGWLLPGTTKSPLPSVAADDEVEVDAPAAEDGAKGGSGGCASLVESNT